jgi:hypothetical protein
MTKLIAVVIVVAVLWGGAELFFYWERVQNEEEIKKKEAASAAVVGESLQGVPYQLETSLQAAKSHGAAALQNWLQTYGRIVQDPRKAWIQLDYCMLISRDNPAEAKRLFAEIKARTPQSSPVWPRIQQLQQTYQ